MNKEKYQQALNTLFMMSSEHLGFELNYEKNLLQELVDIYPEYLELKAKATPMKPEEVERNVYRCLSCEKIIIPIGERKIWHKHFTPCCPNCGQLQDWGEDE